MIKIIAARQAEVGFTLIEIIVVIAIGMAVFLVAVPMYIQYSADNSMRSVGQSVRESINAVISQAVNGVTFGPTPVPSSALKRNTWFFSFTSGGSSYRYGVCRPTEVSYQTCIANPVSWNVKEVSLPSGFQLAHNRTSNVVPPEDLVMYFSPIYGELRLVRGANDSALSETSVTLSLTSPGGGNSRQIDFTVAGNGKVSESVSGF